MTSKISSNNNINLYYNMDIKNLKNRVKKTKFKGNPIHNNQYTKTYLKFIKSNKNVPLLSGDVFFNNKIVKKSTLIDKRSKTGAYKPSVKKQIAKQRIQIKEDKQSKKLPNFTVTKLINKKFNTVDYNLNLDSKRSFSQLQIYKGIDKFSKSIKGQKRVIVQEKFKNEHLSQKAFSTKFRTNLNYRDIKQAEQEADVDSKWVAIGSSATGSDNYILQTNNIPFGSSLIKCPKWLQNTKCLFTIENEDDYCGQRCCAVSIQKPSMILNLRKKSRAGQLTKLANKMADSLNIKHSMTVLDFEVFAQIYKKYVIIFSGKDTIMHNTTDFREGEQDDDIVYIYLDISINHYHLITNINKFTSKSNSHTYKFCIHCLVPYDSRFFNGHKCKSNKCRCCQEFNVTHTKDWANREDSKCDHCNLECANVECLELHIKNVHSYKQDATKFKKCNTWKCGQCKSWVDKERFDNDEHKCGEIKCLNCSEFYNKGSEHSCNIMMGEKTAKSTGDDMTYYCYDFESKFDENNYHIVNLVKVGKMYDDTFSKTFYNIKEFVEWISTLKKSTFIAHNARGYDAWLIHHHLNITFGKKPDNIVLAGQKIMYMVVDSIRFIDSLSFIQSTLSELPKTFGLDTNIIKKGYFPYLFNTDENKNYIGKFPPIEIFEPNKMKCRKDFDLWYNENKDRDDYDFDKELNEYCENDVMILCKSLKVFRDNMKELCDDLDPLMCVTIASYAHKVYLTLHSLTEEELDGVENIERTKKQTGISILTKEQYEVIKRGFQGGRTEVFKLYKNWSEEDIKAGRYGKYIDIVSLYPTCQFLDWLPYGKPIHYTFEEDDEVDINEYFGMCRCDITCPKNLHIPLLGGKQKSKNGMEKFQFGLDDMVDVVFPTLELQKAIKIGYKITRVYEIFHFKKTKQLFKSYIRTFMKGKIEGAGHKGTPEEKIAYCKEYSDKFGIEIKPENLIKNAGKKANSKLLLNSLWGKFGQRQMKSSEYFCDSSKWYKLLKRAENGKVIIHSRQDLGDSLFIEYEETEELKTSLKKTNVALCAMITSNARLRLYEELEKLDNRVVYCDTDSCIYEYDKNKYNTEMGIMLGDWEAEGEEDHKITEFVGIAPKAYSYKLLDESNCVGGSLRASATDTVKSKGVSMSIENQEKITFDSYKKLIDTQIKIKTNMMDFKKSKNGIQTINGIKDISFNREDFKRIIIKDYETLPHGFKVTV